MSRSRRFFRSLLQGLKNFATKNVGIKIVALVFAIVLWGYVMSSINPVQVKVVTGVPISLSGTTDLMNRNLIVVESGSGSASVSVSANINNHSKLSASRVNCTASVATITAPGTYQIPVNASVQSDLGTVASISPSTISVVVDSLVTKPVPVKLELEGEMPSGYEITGQTIANSIAIEGAARYIEPVTKAVVRVPIDGLTEDYESSVNVTFYDADGNEIDVITRTGEQPNMVVQLSVSSVLYAVPIELDLSEYDTEYLDVDITLNFDSIDLLGSDESLAGITSVLTEKIPITADMVDTTVTETIALILPDGVSLRLGQQKTVRATIVVRDAQEERKFVIPIEYTGLSDALELPDDAIREITVLVTGKKKELDTTLASDFAAVVDLRNYEAGVFNVLVTVTYNGDYTFIIKSDTLRISLSLAPKVAGDNSRG